MSYNNKEGQTSLLETAATVASSKSDNNEQPHLQTTWQSKASLIRKKSTCNSENSECGLNQSSLLLSFNGAVKLIPDAQKAAYLEALEVSPTFLETESNPILFLRREGFDPWAAAQRLVSYWEERKKAFGEKAFLPLSFNSYTDETTRALWEGVVLQLPNDIRGRSVIYRDNKKLAMLSLKARLQLVFYMLDGIARDNPRSAEEGFVIVEIMEAINFDRNSKIGVHVAQNSMPLRAHSVHILCSGKDPHADAVAVKLMPWITRGNVHVHVCKTLEERAKALLPYDLRKDCLPQFLGGSATVIPRKGFVREDILAFSSEQSSALYNVGSGANDHLDFPLVKVEPATRAGNSQMISDQFVSKEFKEKAHKKLEEAIRLLPIAKKAAYLDSLKHAPDLIHTESIPAWFLLFEKFDVSAAARRLASYWEERKKIFGEKTLKPLTPLTGEIPYNEEALRGLREGAMMLLPNDNEGRCVFYRDEQKCSKLSLVARTQVQFYVFAKAMRNIESIRQGYVVLGDMDKIFLDRPTVIGASLYAKIIPIPLHSAHIFCKTNTLAVGIVPLWIPCLRWMTTQNVHFHVCQSAEERASKLMTVGFTKAGLPPSLGGDYLGAPLSSGGLAAQSIPKTVVPDRKDPVHNSPNTASLLHEKQVNSGGYLKSFDIPTKKIDSPSASFQSNRQHGRTESCAKEQERKPSRPGQCQSVTVSNNDVLLGKGKKYSVHPGNRSLQDYIKRYKDRHEEAYQKYNKTQSHKDRRLLQQIHRDVYDSFSQRGRFLKCDHEDQTIASDGWYEVDSSVALKKIAISFRYKDNLEGMKQQAQTDLQSITSVLDSDILLGKGRRHSRHPGNLRLLHLIEMHSDRYDELSESHSNAYGNESSRAMNEIVQQVYASVCQTGRFLKSVDDDDPNSPVGWYEVSRDIALQKISMSFRNYRKRKRRRNSI